MESASFLKKYFKVALPLSLAVVLYEEIFIPTSYLNSVTRRFFLGIGENAEIFLSVAGGA
jgi:hypothetical protein